MHARYALIFERGAARHRLREIAAEKGLTIAADLADLLLITEPGTPVLLGKRMAVAGRMWNGGAPIERASDELEALAVSTDLSALPQAAWGNYALFATEDERGPRVYRDPSAAVGLFHLRVGDTSVFLSDAEFGRSIGLLDHAQVDQHFLVHWLQYPFLKTARTGLRDVVEVLPGQWRFQEGGRWTSTQGWSPWQHASSGNQLHDPADAAFALKEVALGTIAALVGDRPLLQLSGGLDSSIVAACLHSSSRDFEAIHFASSSADGDERRFANAVAQVCGISMRTLFEEELEFSLGPPRQSSFGPHANPIVAPINQAMVHHGKAIARNLVDGAGGDNLFCYLLTAAPVLDALHTRASGSVRQTVLDVSQITSASWPQVIRAALRLQLHRLGRLPWKENRSGLHPAACLPSCEVHPWLLASGRALEGQCEHVEAMLQIHHFFDRRADWTLPVSHPLMAQPLIELCLRIPSWMWIERGRDRAIARQAFAGMVPDVVLSRRLKGSLQGYFQRSFAKLREGLREIILSGDLRQLGILDVAWIEAAFAGRWGEDEVQLRLSEMAALELWLSSWRR